VWGEGAEHSLERGRERRANFRQREKKELRSKKGNGALWLAIRTGKRGEGVYIPETRKKEKSRKEREGTKEPFLRGRGRVVSPRGTGG